MAQIAFPQNPVDEQEFIAQNILYTYTASKNLWKAKTLGGGAGGSGGASSMETLTDVSFTSLEQGDLIFYNGSFFVNTDIKYRQIAFPAAQAYDLTTLGAVYKMSNIPESPDNPNITAFAGTTIRFDLNVTGDAVRIQDQNGDDYNEGLTHVDNQGNVLTGISAQGKSTGSLYWIIPPQAAGAYRYQSEVRSSMRGNIKVKGAGNEPVVTKATDSSTLDLDLGSSNVFNITLSNDITALNLLNTLSSGSVVTLVITNESNYSISWPASVVWSQGSAPSLTSSGTDILSLISTDGGTSFYGFISGQNFG